MGKRIVSPKNSLRDNFTGLKYSWECMGHNRKVDGRWLYKLEVESEEIRDVFLEALQPYAGHLKTPESARILAEKLTGRPYAVDGEKIVDVGPPPEDPAQEAK